MEFMMKSLKKMSAIDGIRKPGIWNSAEKKRREEKRKTKLGRILAWLKTEREKSRPRASRYSLSKYSTGDSHFLLLKDVSNSLKLLFERVSYLIARPSKLKAHPHLLPLNVLLPPPYTVSHHPTRSAPRSPRTYGTIVRSRDRTCA